MGASGKNDDRRLFKFSEQQHVSRFDGHAEADDAAAGLSDRKSSDVATIPRADCAAEQYERATCFDGLLKGMGDGRRTVDAALLISMQN